MASATRIWGGISDIAERFDISKQHLTKVVSALSRKGYLDTVRGRGGGIRLRRPPRDINIGQVLRETEDRLDVIGCLGRRDYCPIERVCVLRGVLHDAIQAFLAVLDGYTLADLIKPQRALSSLLLLDQHAARGPYPAGWEIGVGVSGGRELVAVPSHASVSVYVGSAACATDSLSANSIAIFIAQLPQQQASPK
jgi:Rrf2 family nitric oxide-sensitive transcriptional repressor